MKTTGLRSRPGPGTRGSTANRLKISDLLQLAPFKRARLVCGQEGLTNPVKGVNIIEAPDVTDWVRAGDVLLTNFYSLDRLRPLDAFIEKVVAKGLSALIVKVGLFVQTVPDEIVDAARKHHLPIIEIPRDVLYRNIVLCISEHLLSERLGVLERFKEISDYFLSASLANQGALRILKSLEAFVGNPVGLYDGNLQCLVGTTGSSVSLPPANRAQQAAPYYVQSIATSETGGKVHNRYVFPVRVGEGVKLYLTVLELSGELDDLQSIAIESAINALALDFLKQQAVIDVEKQFRCDLISDVLSGSGLPASELHRRARLIQWDLTKTYAVMVVSLKHPHKAAEEEANSKTQLDRLSRYLTNILDDVHSQTREGHVVLFCKATDVKEWRRHLTRRLAELSAVWSRDNERTTVHAGVGEAATTIGDLPLSYRQALDALNIGIKAGFEKDIVFFHELGIYRMLCQFSSQQELRDMVPPSLQKLNAMKPRIRDSLLETLESYIVNNGNALETSRHLKVHPKTVLYRLEKIRSEAGIDLRNSEEMLMVQVGLKILKMASTALAG